MLARPRTVQPPSASAEVSNSTTLLPSFLFLFCLRINPPLFFLPFSHHSRQQNAISLNPPFTSSTPALQSLLELRPEGKMADRRVLECVCVCVFSRGLNKTGEEGKAAGGWVGRESKWLQRPSHVTGEVIPTSRGVSGRRRERGGDAFKIRFHPVILLQTHLPSFSQTPRTKTTCVVNSILTQKASSISSFSGIHSLVSVGLLRLCCDTAHRLLHFHLRPASWLRLLRGGSCCSLLGCHACRCNWSRSGRVSDSSSSLFHPVQRRLGREPMSYQVPGQTTRLSQLLQLCLFQLAMEVEVSLEDFHALLLQVFLQSRVLVRLQPLQLAILLHITTVPKPSHHFRSGQPGS